MAEIHLAKTKGIAGFEKYVALKMIHPNFAEDDQFIQMLVDEAKIAVQLNHGNIAQTFDLGRVGDTFYITMEYVDGADLYKILRKGSEIDFEMPLDVCAFIAKEIASALDHAHRKRDHTGKTLGIVHRDVSPQNVLISFSGEVKLVDFGIAKATMKARQTAVGVIKGKYYYMSPEQAWGDQIDYRSDIFSAGIVLYEMLTGQMLYLEEDLHKLLDMARKAEIAPPSTLRKGIPPQLEKIVMHALEKDRRNRYQSASDFASDLERFLHTYSPVFTASKVANLIKTVIGGPTEIPDEQVEVRDGPMATHTLSSDDLILDKEELQDENSVIFRVADLKPKHDAEKREKKPTGNAAQRVTRQADLKEITGPQPKIKAPTPAVGTPRAPTKPPAKPRSANDETRQVSNPAPPSLTEDSGLLSLATPPPAATAQASWKRHDSESTLPGGGEGGDLENIGESTMITGAPKGFGGFMMDVAGEDGVDATVVSSAPPSPAEDDEEDAPTLGGGSADEEGVTIQRDFRDKPRVAAGKKGPPPAALAAKIQAPAVSEIRKPRASRKTPQGGVPAANTPPPNILQAIVSSQGGGAPMPAPPRQQAPSQPQQPPPQYQQQPPPQYQQQPPPQYQQQPPPQYQQQSPPPQQQPSPQQPPPQYPQPPYPQQPPQYQQQPQYPQPHQYNGYAADASGLPMTPPQGLPQQPYGYPQQPHQQAPMTPGALYQLQPYGAPPPKPMTLTGQLRLFEADEMPSQYNVTGGGAKWIKLVIAGVLAISVAAGVTFFIIKSTRDTAPTVGRVNIESVPPGAEVVFDGTRLAGATPMTVDSVPVGTRHEIRVELARHKAYVETVDIPKAGGEVPVKAMMTPITGKVRVITQPDGAEIWIDGKLRGRAPTTINDIDMASAKTLELRLKDYKPYTQSLEWPANGEINIDQKLQR